MGAIDELAQPTQCLVADRRAAADREPARLQGDVHQEEGKEEIRDRHAQKGQKREHPIGDGSRVEGDQHADRQGERPSEEQARRGQHDRVERPHADQVDDAYPIGLGTFRESRCTTRHTHLP